MNIINTENAPKAIGPYVQGTTLNDLIFISGQIPINPATGAIVSDDFTAQVTQSLTNIKEILHSQGATMDNILKTTVFLTDLETFTDFNTVYATFFKDNFPARTTIEVSRLPLDAKIEIEAFAQK